MLAAAAESGKNDERMTRWKTVRPWLPPQSDGKLELEVIDVSSTAVSLRVLSSPEPDTDRWNAISIKLNSRPWSLVAHTVVDEEGQEGAVIVVYGLEPGTEYEVELDIVEAAEEVARSSPSLPSLLKDMG